MSNDTPTRLHEAYRLIQSGDPAEARRLLNSIIRQEPENANAWFLASLVVADAHEKAKLLRHTLNLDPQHKQARDALQTLESASPEPEPGSSVEQTTLQRLTSQKRLLSVGGLSFILCLIVVVALVYQQRLLNTAATDLATPLASTPQITATPTTWITDTPVPSASPRPIMTGTSWLTADPNPTRLPTSTVDTSSLLTPIPGFEGELGYDVLDADYSSPLDRIIILSQAPNAVHIVDLHTLSDTVVGLDTIPTSLALSLDGFYAVVTRDATVDYIDLRTAQIVKKISVGVSAGDISLAKNGWAYMAPREAVEPVVIAAVNIESEQQAVTEVADFGSNATLHIHPGGDTIYVLSNEYRLEMRLGVNADGTLTPYDIFMNLVFCRGLWFSEDGSKLFGCGQYYQHPESPTESPGFIDRLWGPQRSTFTMRGIADSTKAQRLVALIEKTGFTPDEIGIWNSASYEYITKIDLPVAPGPDKAIGRYGKSDYVFISADGKQCYVIYHLRWPLEVLPAGPLKLYGLTSYDLP